MLNIENDFIDSFGTMLYDGIDMTNKKVTKGEWEVHGKNITTRGGVFVGYASKKEDAEFMAASKKMLILLEEAAVLSKEIREKLRILLKA